MSPKNREETSKKISFSKQVERLKKKKLSSSSVIPIKAFQTLKQNKKSTRVIVVVDDDEIMRGALKRILEQEGYSVILAEDGMELSSIIENYRLDLILLDVNLPWVDGFELCQMIKRDRSLNEVPLILLSGRKEKKDIERGFQSGCDDYIAKPFDVKIITGVINKALDHLK